MSSPTFTITSSAGDDVGVNSVGLTLRDRQGRYLQNDGTVSGTFHTFQIEPDVVGATSTTWSHEVSRPSRTSGGHRQGPATRPARPPPSR